MTSSVIRKYVLAALCGAAIVGVGQSAQAAQWSIFGSQDPASTASYGTANGDNNVINYAPSGVFDSQAGATVRAAGQLQAINFPVGGSYDVSWTYIGSESDQIIQFRAPGVPGFPITGFNEDNRNNQCAACATTTNPAFVGPTVLMGTATSQTDLTPNFTFQDVTFGGDHTFATNGFNPADDVGDANFLMSYAVFQGPGDPLFDPTLGPGLYLTSTPSDIVVIGYNDTGAADDNHDDFMIVAQIRDHGGENEVPIPGALPMLASALGGGFLFRRLRNRRQAKAAA